MKIFQWKATTLSLFQKLHHSSGNQTHFASDGRLEAQHLPLALDRHREFPIRIQFTSGTFRIWRLFSKEGLHRQRREKRDWICQSERHSSGAGTGRSSSCRRRMANFRSFNVLQSEAVGGLLRWTSMWTIGSFTVWRLWYSWRFVHILLVILLLFLSFPTSTMRYCC